MFVRLSLFRRIRFKYSLFGVAFASKTFYLILGFPNDLVKEHEREMA